MLGLVMAYGGAGFGGFSFANFLNYLNDTGFFAYVLPFLLIFALIYAILGVIPLFKDNRGSAIIIAVAIGLLALQFDYVPVFFAEIFPNLGIGLSILLVAMILLGAIVPGESAFKWTLFALGVIIFLVIVGVSLSSHSFSGGYQWSGWWSDYGGLIFFVLIIGGVITAVILGNKKA